MAGTLSCSIFLYVGKVLVVGTLKGYHQIGGLWSMYVNFLLLLRSLRAWGLGVVLVKVAGNLHTYSRGRRSDDIPWRLPGVGQ